MSVHSKDFTGEIVLTALKFRRYANKQAELTAISNSLAADTTSRDVTIDLPPAPVKPGRPQTPFTNAILLSVNKGKGGNLSPAAMAAAINTAMGQVIPPTNTVAPSISGTGTVGQNLVNGSPGTWTPAGATFTRQWQRDGAAIAGATANNYTLVAADSTHSITCAVTATNPAGSNTAVSNAIAVT